MEESKLIWLALGVVVGYILWGHKVRMVPAQPATAPTAPMPTATPLDGTALPPWLQTSGGCACGGHA